MRGEQQHIFKLLLIDLHSFITKTSCDYKRPVKRKRRAITSACRKSINAVWLQLGSISVGVRGAGCQCCRQQAVVPGRHFFEGNLHRAFRFHALDLLGDKLVSLGFAIRCCNAPVVRKFLAIELFQLLADLGIESRDSCAAQRLDGWCLRSGRRSRVKALHIMVGPVQKAGEVLDQTGDQRNTVNIGSLVRYFFAVKVGQPCCLHIQLGFEGGEQGTGQLLGCFAETRWIRVAGKRTLWRWC